MSGRLALRRGVVVSAEPLVVEVAGERRPAWADTVLLGEMREGDEVGRFTVIEVPGHTVGHLAFWRESDRVLRSRAAPANWTTSDA